MYMSDLTLKLIEDSTCMTKKMYAGEECTINGGIRVNGVNEFSWGVFGFHW